MSLISVEYVPMSEVRGWPRNPKLHDLDALGASIDRFGFVQPLTRDDRTGQLVAGHGRLEALARRRAAGEPAPGRVQVRADGEWLVPVLRGIAFETEREAEAYLVADNRMVELGGWDEAGLRSMLEAARVGGELNFAAIGFSDHELREALQVTRAELNQPGPNPREREAGWAGAVIRQVVFHFGAAEYDAVVRRLGEVAAERGLRSNAEVLLALLGVDPVGLAAA